MNPAQNSFNGDPQGSAGELRNADFGLTSASSVESRNEEITRHQSPERKRRVVTVDGRQ